MVILCAYREGIKLSLNAKQQAFVDHYHILNNATTAAIKAKYSEKTAMAIGSKLLKKVEIQQALAVKQKQLQEAQAITTDWLIANAKKVLEYSLQIKPKGKVMISPRFALAANEQIAKLTGLLQTQNDTNITVTIERQEKQLEVLEDFSQYEDQLAVTDTTSIPTPNLQLVKAPSAVVDG